MQSHFSHVRFFVPLWTIARHAPLSTGFSRQEYWSGLPYPPPGDLPNPGIEPGCPALQADSLPSEPPGRPCVSETNTTLYVNNTSIKKKFFLNLRGQIPIYRWRFESLSLTCLWSLDDGVEICQECEVNINVIVLWGTRITTINHHRGYVGNSEIGVFFDPRNGADGGEPGLSSVKLKDVQGTADWRELKWVRAGKF